MPSDLVTALPSIINDCCKLWQRIPEAHVQRRPPPVDPCRGNFLVIVSGGKRLDFAAFVLILVLSVLLCWGMKETKTVNNGPPPTRKEISISWFQV